MGSTTALLPPPGLRLLSILCGHRRSHLNQSTVETPFAVDKRRLRNYQLLVLVVTYVAYMSYHMTRRPIAVVKHELNHGGSCFGVLPRVNVTVSAERANSWCDWPPFGAAKGSRSNAGVHLLGYLDLAYLFSYAMCMFVSGWLAERIHLRYFLTLGMLLAGASTYAFGLGRTFDVHLFAFYLVVQFLGGGLQSTGWPTVVTINANWFSRHSDKGLVFGVWTSHTSVGNILGALLASVFVQQDWALAFYASGVFCAGIGVFFVFLFLPTCPEEVGILLPSNDHYNISRCGACISSDDHQHEHEDWQKKAKHRERRHRLSQGNVDQNIDMSSALACGNFPSLQSPVFEAFGAEISNNNAALSEHGQTSANRHYVGSDQTTFHSDFGKKHASYCSEKCALPASLSSSEEQRKLLLSESLSSSDSSIVVETAGAPSKDVTGSNRCHVQQVEQQLGSSAVLGDHSKSAISLQRAVLIPGVCGFAISLFFAKLVSNTFMYWLPSYLATSAALNSEKSADISTAFDYGGIAGAIFAGWLQDRFGASATISLSFLLLSIPALLVYRIYSAASFTANIVLLVITGFLVNGPCALITTAVSAELGTHPSVSKDSNALATVTAIIDGTGSIGAALGPLFAALLADVGPNWLGVFLMLMIADFFASLCLLPISNRELRRRRERYNYDDDTAAE